jgi:uncharacterized protein (DUF362 family)
VSFVRVKDSSYDALKAAISDSLNLIQFDYGRKANKIVIKPNMCYYYHPSTGEVTDPQFVSALIDVLRESFRVNAEIFIVEADASAMKCKYSFHMLGYDKMAQEKNVTLVNLSEAKSKIVEIGVGGSQFRFHVPEIFYDSDLVVNVPKLKYMRDVKITCALKNIFGCNAYPKKSIYHKALNEAIVGMNKLIKTDLVVVDGLVVSGKTTKRLDLVMSSEDPVAVDVAASKLMGIKPTSVGQIVLASKEGIGYLGFSPVGDFSYFAKAFPKKGLKDNMLAVAAAIYLRVLKED